jgi:hypothetical protein
MGPIHEFRIRRLGVETLEDRLTPSLSLVGVPGADHAPSPLAFAGFDNPAPGDSHPATTQRSQTAVTTTGALSGTNPTVQNPSFGNEGPWSAHYVSPVISCTIEPDCPMDPTPYVPHP